MSPSAEIRFADGSTARWEIDSGDAAALTDAITFVLNGLEPTRTSPPEAYRHDVRVFPPDPTAGDLGPMFVLDALGVSALVRQREDGMYVHIDRDAATEAPAGTEGQPLIVEVNNGGENTYS